jgi:hypothetical protein
VSFAETLTAEGSPAVSCLTEEGLDETIFRGGMFVNGGHLGRGGGRPGGAVETEDARG